MRSEDTLFIFLAIIIGVPLGLWFYRDGIYGFIQMVDLAILQAYSWLDLASPVPLIGSMTAAIGDYFGRWANAYGDLSPSQLTYQHTWVAGNAAWRPIAVAFFAPLMLHWAWKARKVRRAQSFQNMTKGFLDKHLKSPQTVKGTSRQQWTVRRWFYNYKLHGMKWGSARWHRRFNEAFMQQLGAPITDKKAAALVDEFAEFMYREAERQFGDESAKLLPVSVMKSEAKASHAYVSTAMVRILAAARDQFGVLSPNRFRNRLFRSPETTPIWFALNGFGRQTTHVESLAILSHFYEEVCKGQAIKEPQFDNALAGLNQYREHHTERRKLKDLDESEALAAAKEREDRKNAPKEASPSAEKRYKRGEQSIA